MYQTRIYLDIDGVLSPLPPPGWTIDWTPPGTWTEWVDPHAFNRTPMPVRLLDELAGLHDRGIEVVWATTWPADMIDHALNRIGRPLPFRHLSPAGQIDKTVAVDADIETNPLPHVWIDDAYWPATRRTTTAPRLRLRPNPHIGLTPRMWQQALRWLARHRTT